MPDESKKETKPEPMDGSTNEGISISPSLEYSLEENSVPIDRNPIDSRVVVIGLLAVGLAIVTTTLARGLIALINLVTNLVYLGHLSVATASPSEAHPALWLIFVPAIGGLLVGYMARYGSQAIRGHGIPEAMEQVLTNESRIPPKITFLKPVSSAIAIGTGGPFGAEGPIIATGGALGSLLGQLLHTTASERKTLLAAGAAAGMTAIFSTPVSAAILAVELLLFEFKPRSLIPVSLGCATAAAFRGVLFSSGPVFPMPNVLPPIGESIFFYAGLGAVVGVLSVLVTKLVYAIEDGFEHLPIQWMWWPAVGGLVVGVIGHFAPRTLGVGYENIEGVLNSKFLVPALVVLAVAKLASWSIALGSGTSGGTLAPLLTIGGAIGAILGSLASDIAPLHAIDPRIAALVGMAAMFAGASRALLTSVVFAFEATLQPEGILPLLAGCTMAYLVSAMLMRNTIMTEKIVRRGIKVPNEYTADYLAQILVGSIGLKPIVTLRPDQTLKDIRSWLRTRLPEAEHQGYPVVDSSNQLVGVVTRRNLFDIAADESRTVGSLILRSPVVIFPDQSLRDAADHMVRENVGRLPIVERSAPSVVVGIITRSDLLQAHAGRLDEEHEPNRGIDLRARRKAS
ncbi:chloride channel protein [soil metagenome]